MLTFSAEKHLYESLPDEPQIPWVSGTKLIGFFKNPFDALAVAKKSVKKKTNRDGTPNKWFGMDPVEVALAWQREGERAATDGTAYHEQQERLLLGSNITIHRGKTLVVYPPLTQAGTSLKLAPVQRLSMGSYPEHLVYLASAGVCGQADRVDVFDDVVDVGDYKTYKELKTSGYEKWDGTRQCLQHVLSHVEDCNYNSAALQMSLYLYIILRHNPNLKPGKLTLYHVQFKSQMHQGMKVVDKFGYPVYEYGPDESPIVERVDEHELPYMKKEVEAMLRYFTANRHKLLV